MGGKCASNRISTTLPRTETTTPEFAGIFSPGSVPRRSWSGVLICVALRPKQLLLVQPFSRFNCVGVIEVRDRRFRKRLAERRHAMLPLLFRDHREPFDVGEVFKVELNVLPQGASFPAMETGHIEQHAQPSVLSDESLEFRHKSLVVCFHQFPTYVNGEHLSRHFLR